MKKNRIALIAAGLITMTFISLPLSSASAQMSVPLPDDYKYTGSSGSDPALVLTVDEDLLTYKIDNAEEVGDETYNPADRRYAGMPAIAKQGDRLWTTWRSGYTWEGKYNYFPLCYSDDGGKTWVDPYIIIDHPDTAGKGVGVGTPYLWTDPDGNMWLFYLTNGVWGIKFSGADGDLSQMTYEIRHLFSTHLVAKAPTVIKNEKGEEEWMFICYSTSASGLGLDTTAAYVSADKGRTWTEKGRAKTKAARKYAEASVLQLSDGTLWQICRLENIGGGLERSVSTDYGKTWSDFERDLPQPFCGPSSKPHYISLGDGKVFAVNHDSMSDRTNLTAYLSEDDGKTWPYRLLLDDRADVSYPDAVYDDGTFYVVYDRARNSSQEIRLAVFGIEDIKAGKIVGEDSALRQRVYQCKDYVDIVSKVEKYDSEIQVETGSDKTTALNGLPSVVNVIDENGECYTLNGEWSLPIYFSTKEEGSFYAKFSGASQLPEHVQDLYSLLKVKVTVKNKAEGCNSALKNDGFLPALTLGAVAAGAVALKRKKHERQD